MKNKKPQYILTLMIISLMFLFSIGLSIWIITDTIIVKPSETNQTNKIIIEYLDKQDGTYNGNILLPSNTAFGLDINSERLTYSYKKENSDGTYPAEFTEVDLENQLGPIDAGNYKIKVSFVNYDNPETPIEQELDFVVKPRSIEDAVVVFDREDGNLFYVGHTYDNFVEKLQVSIVLVENAQATNLIIDDDFTVSTPDLSTLNNNAETKIVGKGNYTDELTVNYSVENPELIVELSKDHPAYDKNTGAYVFEYSKSGIDFNGVIIVKDPLTKEKVTPTSIEYSYKGLAEQGDYINLGLPSTVATYWVKAVVSLTGYDSVTVDSIQVKINPISISTAVVTLEDITLTYNGAPQIKEVKSVVVDGDTLNEGEDYEAPVYSNNTDAGNMKAVVTINGKGMYADSVKVYFTIEKATPTVTAPTYAKYAFIEGEQPKITTAGKGTFIKTKGDGTKETTPTVISGTIISKINGVDIDVYPFEEGDSSTKTVKVTYTFVPSDVNSNGTSNYNQDGKAEMELTMYGVAYNATQNVYWGTIEKGIENAVANDKVWVVPDIYRDTTFYPTLKENTEIPSGITFGLAYMKVDETVTPDAVYNDTDKATSADGSANPSRAIIDEGVTLTVKSGGTLHIGAFVGDTGTVSKAAVLMNNGSIIINSGGTVYSYGYTKGSGLFKLESGGTVYDVLKIYDFAGGRYAPGMYFKEFNVWENSIPQERLNNILPFQSFSMHNISCELKIYAGATFYTRADLNISQTIYVQNIVLFGTGGLFELSPTEGFSENYVKRTVENTVNNNDFNSEWDSTNQSVYQKEVYEFNTSVKDNIIQMHIAMKFEILGREITINLDFKTDKYTAMPIGMMDITIKNGHTITIESNSWKFLPGSRLFIEQGAKFIVDSGVNIILYEDYYDNFTVIDSNGNANSPASFSYYSKHTSLYDTTTKKVKADYVTKMYIDGTLECNGNIGGTISASSTTGKVVLTSGAATLRRLSSIKYLDTGTVAGAAAGWSNFGGSVYSDTHNTKMHLYNGSTINVKSNPVSAGTYNSISAGGQYGWYTDKITISYDLNGGTGTVPPTTSEKDVVQGAGYVVTNADIPSITPTRLGYEFTGNWALDVDGNEIVVAGETTLFTSTTFYPVWEPIEYTIDFEDKYYNNFDSNNTQIEYDEFKFYVTISEPLPNESIISNGEYVFGGWYLDANCTIRVYTTNDIYIHTNASTYLASTTVKLYGLWYPKDTKRIVINYSSSNEDIDYLEFMSFTIATESDWSKVRIPLLTENDNNPKEELYFGGWKINGTETIITTETYFTKDNYTNYFTADEYDNLVCNLTAIWTSKVKLSIYSKVSTNAAVEKDYIFYKPGYTLVLSSIVLEIEEKTVLTEWQYSGGTQTGTASYSATEITLNSATQLIAIIKKVVTVRVSTVTNPNHFASYSLYISQYVQYVSDTYVIQSSPYEAKPTVNTEVLAVEGATITIKGTGKSYWFIVTRYYEVDLTIGTITKSGGNATEVINTTSVGTSDLEVKFEAS